MGFLPNYDREGPGVPPDAPRKTGLPRFWEVLSRDFWDVFRAGFLALSGTGRRAFTGAGRIHLSVAPACFDGS